MRPHRVAVVALDLFVAFDLGTPAQVFGAARERPPVGGPVGSGATGGRARDRSDPGHAGSASGGRGRWSSGEGHAPEGAGHAGSGVWVPGVDGWSDVDPMGLGAPYYEVVTVGLGPVRAAGGGFTVVPDLGLDALATADTVIVPGVHGRSALVRDGGTPEPVLRALREFPGRIMSICTGAFVLAEAGLLDGLRATTHWDYAELFRARYPQVDLDPDVLFVDGGRVLTSAGVAAGIDLCLHVVRSDHGSEVANRAARRCVVPSWRDGGQSQFIERPVPETGDASTGPTRGWALTRLEHDLDLRAMAAHARMSVRTFTRRFREETGLSPARWLAAQRVERARQLLETTDLPVDRIAERAGFGTATSLRQHLHGVVGVSPAAYRNAFRR